MNPFAFLNGSARPIISGSVSIVPHSMPLDFAQANMELAPLSGQLFAPDLLEMPLSVPMASSTLCPPFVQAYPFAPPIQSAQTFFCAIDPSDRKKYADKIYTLLKENGKLAGVLFNHEFEKVIFQQSCYFKHKFPINSKRKSFVHNISIIFTSNMYVCAVFKQSFEYS